MLKDKKKVTKREMVSDGYVNSKTKRVSSCFKGLYHIFWAQTMCYNFDL